MATKIRRSELEAFYKRHEFEDSAELLTVKRILVDYLETYKSMPTHIEFKQRVTDAPIVFNYLLKNNLGLRELCEKLGYRIIHSPKHRVNYGVENVRNILQKIQRELELFYIAKDEIHGKFLQRKRLPTRKEFDSLDCRSLKDVKRIFGWDYPELIEHLSLSFDVSKEQIMKKAETIDWSYEISKALNIVSHEPLETEELVENAKEETSYFSEVDEKPRTAYATTHYFKSENERYEALQPIISNLEKGSTIEIIRISK